jgi:aquaporin Z
MKNVPKKNTATVVVHIKKTAATAQKHIGTAKRFVDSTPQIGFVVAEFIGTFLITIAFLVMQANPLFFAFAYIGVTLLISRITGAHLNPAITLGAFATRKIGALNAMFYVVAQVLGAVIAWIVLDSFLQSQSSASSTLTQELFQAATIPADKEWHLFYAELLGVTILATGVASAMNNVKSKLSSAILAGMTVVIALYFTLTQTSPLLTTNGEILTFINPAIAAAGQALSWQSWPIAIYIVAPVLGGVIGFLISDFLRSQQSK